MINDFNFGSVAQMVERWIEDPSVVGSIPTGATISPRSLMDRQRISNPSHVGSNPTGEAIKN